MRKIVLFTFLFSGLIIGLFLIHIMAGYATNTVTTQDMTLTLNQPQVYDSSSRTVTSCSPVDYLQVQGSLTVNECSNAEPYSVPAIVSLDNAYIGSIPIHGSPNSATTFSKSFVLGNSNGVGGSSGSGTCTLTGSAVVQQNTGSVTFTLNYSNINGVPVFSGNPSCGIDQVGGSYGSLVGTPSCNPSGCTFTCNNYTEVGSMQPSAIIQNGNNYAQCATQITVASVPAGSCTLSGTSNINQGGTATFNLTYSGLGTATPIFAMGYPICGADGTLVSSSCNSLGCTFTCNNYGLSGTFPVSAEIESTTDSATTCATATTTNCTQNSDCSATGQYICNTYNNIDKCYSVDGSGCTDGSNGTSVQVCDLNTGKCGNINTLAGCNTQLTVNASSSYKPSLESSLASLFMPSSALATSSALSTGLHTVSVQVTMSFCWKGTNVCFLSSPKVSASFNVDPCSCYGGYISQDGICIQNTKSDTIFGDCPGGYISQDGICIQNTKTDAIYGNCPGGYISQDGICIQNTKTDAIYGGCPTGYISQDGICIQNTKTDTIYGPFAGCADNTFAAQDGLCLKENITSTTPFCGDNTVNGNEQCDGTDSTACPGACNAPGTQNQCMCPNCGNSIKEAGEQCDSGSSPGAINANGCTGGKFCSGCICRTPVCGDNVKNQISEQCDGTDSTACPGACIAAGQPNQCTCPPPSVSSMVTNENDCIGSSGVSSLTLGWNYNNGSGGESRYQLQVEDKADVDAGGWPTIPQINVDTGTTTFANSYNSYSAAISSISALNFGTAYNWRVKVYDNGGQNSGWQNGTTFKTVAHAAPTPTINFSPSIPLTKQVVSFLGSAISYDTPSYLWTFDDNTTSIIQNPPGRTYTIAGTYPEKLKVCDLEGECCQTSKPLQVKNPLNLPTWKEISPF